MQELQWMPLRQRRKVLRSQRNPYPRFLYRYRSFANPKQEREVFIENKLHMSSPARFNDPFDMQVRYVFEGTDDEKRRRLRAFFARNIPALGGSELEEEIERSLKQDMAKKAWDAHNKVIEASGVCCFNGDPRSILMWSHYASNHDGICLQFDVACDPRAFVNTHRMKYDNKYPVINFGSDAEDLSLFTSLTNKALEWQYEGERRFIERNGAGKKLGFRSDALTGLILGCKLSVNKRSDIKTVIDERAARKLPDIRIYQGIQSKSDYKLRLQFVGYRVPLA